MKNNQLYVILIAIIFTAFATSCTPTAPKMLMGTWKGVKAAPIEGTNKRIEEKNATAQNTAAADTTKAKKKGKGAAAGKEGEKVKQREVRTPEQVAKSLSVSEITFKDNKHLQISYNRIVRDVKYKYKAKTKQLVMKDKEFGRFICDIETMENDRLGLIEHLPNCDYIVVYRRK